MIITKSFLREYASMENFQFSDTKKTLFEDFRKGDFFKEKYDLFLSHSFLDQELILALVDLFHKGGYSVYVDWLENKELDRSNVTRNTAEIVRMRIKESKGLGYIATSNIAHSKWCPWELGYADGFLSEKVLILPILSQQENFKGQEYLGLYPYLEYEKNSITHVYEFWVINPEKNEYKEKLSHWLNP